MGQRSQAHSAEAAYGHEGQDADADGKQKAEQIDRARLLDWRTWRSANVVSNLAYLVAALVVAAHPLPQYEISIALANLCVGSALWHAKPHVEWRQLYDRYAMIAVVVLLATLKLPALLSLLAVAVVCGATHRYSFPSTVVVGVFAVAAAVLLFVYAGWVIGLSGLALFSSVVVVRHHDSVDGLGWTHATWHVGAAAATVLGTYGQLL